MKKLYVSYIILFLIIITTPFACMTFAMTTETSENSQLVTWSPLLSDEGINIDYLSDAGNWFEDHFAFRESMVTIAAKCNAMFVTSTADNVIKGTNNWLYYKDSLDDYLGRNTLSDRELINIVHNLSLVQQYVESTGGTFALVIPPNKNSLYNENMPYYYGIKYSKDSNIDLLKPMLENAGINYIDLFGTFENQTETLYFARDSHWNNKGALLAYNTIMDGLGVTHNDFNDVEPVVIKNHIGDLDTMLFPKAETPEMDYDYSEAITYDYVYDTSSNFDPVILTNNENKTGSIVVFRDSFANALVPFFSNEFQTAYYARTMPYSITYAETYLADYVIIEKAERFISELSTNVMVYPASLVDNEIADNLSSKDKSKVDLNSDESIENNNLKTISSVLHGQYVGVTGFIDEKNCHEYINNDTEIYCYLSGKWYETSWISEDDSDTENLDDDNGNGDYGFACYIPVNEASESMNVKIAVKNGEDYKIIYNNDIEMMLEYK